MRYYKITSLALLFSLSAVALANAQDDAPRRLRRPMEVVTLQDNGGMTVAASASESTGTEIVADTTMPQAKRDSHSHTGSVADRMRSMRRRAVDLNLGRSFVSEPAAQMVQHQGELPAVPRRPAGKPTPSSKEGVTETPQATSADSAESPAPTPAQQVPSPALDRVNIATKPMATQKRSAIRANSALQGAVTTVPAPIETRASKRAEANPDGVILTNRAPAITFETIGPRQIVIGQESIYQIRMINMGDVPAQNMIVTVKMPTWAEVNSSSATRGTPITDPANDVMSRVTWELRELVARGNETLTLGIVPRDRRPIDLAVGWAFNPEHATAQIEVQEPMLTMEINGPTDVNFGETATFSISLSNPGTGDAKNVVLNLMPSSQQRVTGSREIGTLKMGERKTVEIELTAHQAGRLQVRAMVQAEGGLRDESNKDVLVRRANLQMALLGPPRNYAASAATYKVRIENTGDAVAEDAVAVATLPAGATFMSASDSGAYLEDRGQVEWQVGALQPGTARVLQLQCELHNPGENRMDVHCAAARELNVAKSVVTHVEALADLKLYVDDPKGAIAVGEMATYEVRIENRGTKAAELVQIIGYFSEGIEPVSVRGVRGELATGQIVIDPIPVIEAGQDAVFQITARASQPGNHVFRVELQCSQPETRLASEEWTKYYTAASGGEVRQAMAPASMQTDSEGQTFKLESR
jgi:uncharacterized repeat protein (TIGR01451 family)